MFQSRRFLAGLALALPIMASSAQTHPAFSGAWKQNNDRCVPKQRGEATITVEDRNQEITVDIASVFGSGRPSRAVKRYRTDGKPSMMKDSEGDEIDTSVLWRGADLVFSTDEHEDGRVLHTEEVWTVIDEGGTLQRVRKGSRSGQIQTLIYDKVVAPTAASALDR